MLTKSQVWCVIANAFIKPPSKRSKLEKKLTTHGICWALDILQENDLISNTMGNKIFNKIDEDVVLFRGDKEAMWFCEKTRPNQIHRAHYCDLQSYITEE